MNFITIDIESFTTDVTKPCIVQIGVCLCYEGEFYTHAIYVHPLVENIDVKTLQWWSTQEGYRHLIDNLSYDNSKIAGTVLYALETLSKKLISTLGFIIPKNKTTAIREFGKLDWYANPPQFDMAMIENQIKLERGASAATSYVPWGQWRVKCQSTLRLTLGKDLRDEAIKQTIEANSNSGIDRVLLQHDAGFDAEMQAREMVMLLRRAKGF